MHVQTWIFAARDVKNILQPHFYIPTFCDILPIMKRSIWFWAYFIIAIVLAIYVSTRIVMTGMGRGAGATVRSITVSADPKPKDFTALTMAAKQSGNRTYSINLTELNQRIKNTPGVKNSAVRRRPNGNLDVRAQMYTAVALWTDDTSYFPLSADGKRINRPTDTRDALTVLFRGPVPDDISSITAAAHTMIEHVDYLEWIEGRRWNLVTPHGITVMLPESNPTGAISALIVLNNNHKILSRDIRMIDMRDDARILVK